MTGSEDFEKAVSHAHAKRSLFHALWLTPIVAATFPYFSQPATYPEDPGLVDFTVAQLEFLFGVFPYLWENPWMAALAVPSVLWIVGWIRYGPIE